ncbi:hypothetical protein TorRG33x02_232450 [Trema orientale]|uniref:Uncharacterized protein n=1 Tax=Trema orientale TaxID=63057 RepID=A0A2P5E660_TREOI|nr:hypothetical protein TorRG33x02_232450 [Trema orientale]
MGRQLKRHLCQTRTTRCVVRKKQRSIHPRQHNYVPVCVAESKNRQSLKIRSTYISSCKIAYSEINAEDGDLQSYFLPTPTRGIYFISSSSGSRPPSPFFNIIIIIIIIIVNYSKRLIRFQVVAIY